MKQGLLILFAISFCSANLFAQTPLAWYRFDNDFNDYAGSNNGTNSGASLAFGHFTTGFNQGNQCAQFNGTGAHINLGAGNTLRPATALTVSAWFILENMAGAISGRQIVSCTEASGYNLGYDKTANTLVFQVYRNGAYGSPSVTAAPYENNGWHHIAGSFDGRYTRLYIDGELKATDDAGAAYPIGYGYPFGNVNTYIGAEAAAGLTIDPNYYWQGKIDELKIYPAALTAAQIKADADFLPGSGKAVNFAGLSNSAYLYCASVTGVNDFAVNQDFTVECWFKAPVTQAWPSPGVSSIVNASNGPINYDIYIYNPPHIKAGKIEIQRWDGSNNPFVTSVNPVNDNKWHHCAFIRSGGTSGTISLYIDGVLQGAVSDNTGNTLTNYYMKAGGVGGAGYGNFSGPVDEIRIWNTALTAAQLRERMCRSITIADALWNNLTVYYKLDEDDQVGNPASPAVIVNAAKTGHTANANYSISTAPHVSSGAPIGNASAFDYSGTPSATFAHPQGESLQATATSGSPSGIHVYSVQEPPNHTTGATGTGSNDRYFGVFVAGGTAPQYTATYHYTGNPFVNAGNEASLLLHKRDDNADASWENCNAALNTTANTLTATGQNTEYILGLSSGSLPVSLLHFEAQKQGSAVLLQWATAWEQNNRGFEVQHSTNGTDFTATGFVNGRGNSNVRSNYSFIHPSPATGNNYYRLKQTDDNGRVVYSRVLLVRFDASNLLTVYPNPVTDVLVAQLPGQTALVTLYDATGKQLWQRQPAAGSTLTIPVAGFTPGLMLLEAVTTSGERVMQKVLKQ